MVSIIYKGFKPNNKEVLRKIIHIGIGPLIPFAKFLDINQTAALYFTGLVSCLIFINYQSNLFPTIEDIDRKSYGTLFYSLSLLVLIYLYWDKDPTSLIAGFFTMTFGDGLAGLVGKNFKSKSWTLFKQKKSLFGTLTMFLSSLIVIIGLSYYQKYNFNINFFTIAFVSTVLEQLSFFGIDNFIVPISAAICFNFFITGL